MVMAHVAGGELVSHPEKLGCVLEKQAQRIFTPMVGAANYCHENSIAHRDTNQTTSRWVAKEASKRDLGLVIEVTSGHKFKCDGAVVCGVLRPGTQYMCDSEGFSSWVCS